VGAPNHCTSVIIGRLAAEGAGRFRQALDNQRDVHHNRLEGQKHGALKKELQGGHGMVLKNQHIRYGSDAAQQQQLGAHGNVGVVTHEHHPGRSTTTAAEE
jgi:hypothetical protein